jgi:hypothetical protein
MHRRGSPETSDAIERVQLERLAATILSRSPHELAEIANANPAIYSEWIVELRRRNELAHKEAQRMSQALQTLLEASKRAGKSDGTSGPTR